MLQKGGKISETSFALLDSDLSDSYVISSKADDLNVSKTLSFRQICHV